MQGAFFCCSLTGNGRDVPRFGSGRPGIRNSRIWSESISRNFPEFFIEAALQVKRTVDLSRQIAQCKYAMRSAFATQDVNRTISGLEKESFFKEPRLEPF